MLLYSGGQRMAQVLLSAVRRAALTQGTVPSQIRAHAWILPFPLVLLIGAATGAGTVTSR